MYFENPFEIVIQAARNVKKIDNIEIYFTETLKKFLCFGKCGFTWFPNRKKDPIQIYISANIKVKHALEILAHELAHVMVGYKAGHNSEWEKYFSEIHNEYIKLSKREENV